MEDHHQEGQAEVAAYPEYGKWHAFLLCDRSIHYLRPGSSALTRELLILWAVLTQHLEHLLELTVERSRNGHVMSILLVRVGFAVP